MSALLSKIASPLDDLARRRNMVDGQLRTFDVTDHAVLVRFLEVPREKFLPPELAPVAYSDAALRLPAGAGSEPRVLLPPAVLARLIQAAVVQPSDKVLDVASGSGYSTALLAGLAHNVVALEADAARSNAIKANLAALGITSVRVVTGVLREGAASEAPFDVILVNGAVEAHLDRLLQQLRPGGRLVTIRRPAQGPGSGASHAIRFDDQAGVVSATILFDATAPVLTEFCKEPEFVF